MSTDERQLLLTVVKGHRFLESVLEGFLELELPGATVVDARGMGQIVATEIPVFSGFRSLFKGGMEDSYVIMSVLSGDQIREAFALIEDICGSFAESGLGIAFTVPVTRFLGPGREEA